MLFILSLVSLVSAQANFSQPGAAVPCKDVHIFLARGNNEPYPGRQGKLVEAICDGLPSCSYEDVQFYNPYEASYAASVQEGATNGVKQVTAYSDACPESQIVLSGYSQGANVIGDVLGGGYGVFFHDYVEDRVYGLDINSNAAKQIKAAVLFGDTRHVAGQSYNVETGAEGTGIFPRPADLLASLNQFAPILRNYCVKTDPICAANLGPEEVETHLSYFDVFSNAAAVWVKSMLEANVTMTSTTSSTSAFPVTPTSAVAAAASDKPAATTATPTAAAATSAESATNLAGVVQVSGSSALIIAWAALLFSIYC